MQILICMYRYNYAQSFAYKDVRACLIANMCACICICLHID